jgi:hypothetical protein
MMLRALAVFGLFLASSLGIVCSANATILAPGTAGFPDTGLTSWTAGTVQGSILGASWAESNGQASGTYSTEVISDPGNVFGAGDLTFVYQVTNGSGSSDALGRITASSFSGFLTDVGVASFGGTEPTTVDRSANGSVIGFNFILPPLGSGELAPGQTSDVLVIETNATLSSPGILSLINSTTTTVAAFEPTPLPGALPLLATGLVGLWGLGRKRRARGRLDSALAT